MLRALASGYIQLIQGTPLLIVLFLTYFGLRHPGLQADPLVAAGISLTIYAAAYLGEIWRGCIEAVPQHAVGGGRMPGASTRCQQYAR